MNSKKQAKGQSFMPDFMASLVVFGVIASIFLFSWNSILSDRSNFSYEEMRRNAGYSTGFLVSTPGFPSNWTNETVQIPGFASNENIINTTKLAEFDNLSSSRRRELLEVKNFSLTFENDSGIIEANSILLEWGYDPVNPDKVVPITRNILINRSGNLENAKMRYVVWQ